MKSFRGWARLGSTQFMVVATLLMAGCSQAPSDVKLARVRGVVTIDGVPAANVRVEFNPAPDLAPRTGKAVKPPSGSVGMTNDKGEYDLRYDANRYGAAIGLHRITARTLPAPDPEDRPAPPERIPVSYNDASGQTYEVKAGDNKYDLSIQSQPQTAQTSGSGVGFRLPAADRE